MAKSKKQNLVICPVAKWCKVNCQSEHNKPHKHHFAFGCKVSGCCDNPNLKNLQCVPYRRAK